MPKTQEVSLAAFRGMDGRQRVELYQRDPLKFRELAAAQSSEAVARLVDATRALRETPDAPVTISLGPIAVPWNALVWQVSPETRLSVRQAAEALNLTRAAIYTLVASGKLPRVKLGGRLSFTAAMLRSYVTENEVPS